MPRLEALGYPCNEVNVGAATQFPDQFANLKAQLYCKLRDDRAEAIMLAFADRTPGIFAYVKQKAQHQQAVETAIRQGKPPPPEPDDADELADAYNQVMPELEGGGSTCPKCGGALGVTTTTINTDGRSYHPECARGW